MLTFENFSKINKINFSALKTFVSETGVLNSSASKYQCTLMAAPTSGKAPAVAPITAFEPLVQMPTVKKQMS